MTDIVIQNIVQPLTLDNNEVIINVVNNPINITLSNFGVQGAGVPAGGIEGQVLAKKSDADYDMQWQDEGSGTVREFSFEDANGFIGVVTNPTSTPELELSVNVEGVLRGENGALATSTTSNLPEGKNLYFTDARAQDAVGDIFDDSLVYDPGTPLISRAALDGDISAAQGSNTLILNTVNNDVGTYGDASKVAVITVNAKGLITAASGVNIIINTSNITNNAVTYAKMQSVSTTSKLLGSSSTTTPVQEITIGSGLSLSGTILTASGLGGTVTNFSAGNLSPLFTTDVSNPTTTPGLSFNLSNANANTWFGNNTVSSAVPSFNSSAAITKADDTNVTLTLGGSPNTALLNTASLTLGWTGTLAAERLNANVVQSVANDTNITGSISTQNLTLGWTGTLAANRLNSNVVQSVTNDTNITGSISAQNLTLSWAGQLGLSRGGVASDLSATGGASQVLKQSFAGAAITVGQLATSDLSDISTFNLNTSGTGSFGGALNMNNQLINNVADPLGAGDAVNKSYVDALVSGLSPKNSAKVATDVPLPSNIYNNGSSGVGATLTASAPGALTVDGVAVLLGDRVVVKNEVAPAHNGIYICTVEGAIGVAYVLTRTSDADTSAELDGAFIFVESGTVNAATGWLIANSSLIIIGTTTINFTQFSGAGTYLAGTGLTLTGNIFSITNTGVSAASYGGSTAIPVIAVNAQGQITSASTAVVIAPAGTLSGPTLASGVTSSSLTSFGTSPTFITPLLGTPTSGVLTNCTGLPLTSGVTGILPAANGGTGNNSYAVGDLLYASGITTLSKLADVATGNALISGGVGVAPSYGKIGLTTHINGILPIANGGTNNNAFTTNSICYFDDTSITTTANFSYTSGQLLVGTASTATGAVAVFDGDTTASAKIIIRSNNTAGPSLEIANSSALTWRLISNGSLNTGGANHLMLFCTGGSGNVLINNSTGGLRLQGSGGCSFGALYASVAAPTNGMICQGIAGFGTNSPLSVSSVNVNGALAYSSRNVNPLSAQVVITNTLGGRLYLGTYYTSGSGAASTIQSSDFFSSVDHGSELLLQPLGGSVAIGAPAVLASAKLYTMDESATPGRLVFDQYRSSSGVYSGMTMRKARGTFASPTTIINGDTLGSVEYFGYDGSNFVIGASIGAIVNGLLGTNDMPTDLTFRTTSDGASTTTERFRLSQQGSYFSNCNAGITTSSGTTPVRLWHIIDTTNGTGTNAVFFQASGTAMEMVAWDGTDYNNLAVRCNSSTQLYLSTGGQAGLGTSTMGGLLNLNQGTSTVPTEITMTNSAYDSTQYQRIGVGNSSNQYTFYMSQNATQDGANWEGITNGFGGTARKFQINDGIYDYVFSTASSVTGGGTITWRDYVKFRSTGGYVDAQFREANGAYLSLVNTTTGYYSVLAMDGGDTYINNAANGYTYIRSYSTAGAFQSQVIIHPNGSNMGINCGFAYAKLSICGGVADNQTTEFGYNGSLGANYMESINRNGGASVDFSFYMGGTTAWKWYTNGGLKMVLDGSGNFSLGGAGSFGGGVGVAFITDAGTVPASNPTGGGILYSQAGAGKWRGTGGTITTFGPAEPHCPKCGADFAHEWENPLYGGKIQICKPCNIDYDEKLRKSLLYMINDDREGLESMRSFLEKEADHVRWNSDRKDKYKNIKIPALVGKDMVKNPHKYLN